MRIIFLILIIFYDKFKFVYDSFIGIYDYIKNDNLDAFNDLYVEDYAAPLDVVNMGLCPSTTPTPTVTPTTTPTSMPTDTPLKEGFSSIYNCSTYYYYYLGMFMVILAIMIILYFVCRRLGVCL